jgi:flagellar biosynthesis protein FlhF
MIVSTDTYRVAATEQLRSYAATIGMAFQTADTPQALVQLLEEHRSKELILIDTPGYGPGDIDAGSDLARSLSLHPEIEVQLVLPVTMRFTDVAAAARRYAPFGASKIIATKLDESSCYGAVVSQAVLSGLPISFLCTGQQIPDDIEPATTERLLSFLYSHELDLAASAA